MVEDGSEEWHKKRSEGIGGSDAAIIMGISPWKSKLELWTEKVEGIRREFNSDNPLMKWGKLLEPLIAEEYCKMTNRHVITDEDTCRLKHPFYKFMVGNVDGIIDDDIKGNGILEIKTKSPFVKWNSDWKNGNIPEYYKLQLQHYLMAGRYKWGSFAILDLSSMEITWFDVEADCELRGKLIKEEHKFWNSVVNKIRPNVDDSKHCNDFLRDYYKHPDEDLDVLNLENNDIATKWGKQLSDAKNTIKYEKSIETEALNHLMDMMGVHEKAIGDDFSINWKSSKDKNVFNKKLFEEENPELYNKYVKSEPQARRFYFKDLK